MLSSVLTISEQGLHCAAGGFHVDPWRAVDRAVITHAHADHARPGCRSYLCAREGLEVLRVRLGAGARIESVPYRETVTLGGTRVSFHPAGHVLGSSQVRVEHRGEVWVVSGDYKVQADPTCEAFEPVKCHAFVTESTFALPIYRWTDPVSVFAEIDDWWRSNQEQGRTSVLRAYALGKAQRLLAGLDPGRGPILAGDAVREFLPAYAAAGIVLPEVGRITTEAVRAARGRGLIVTSGTTGEGDAWKAAGERSAAFASGWMLVRGIRRRQGVERGFVLSDHADWPGLISAIRATGAERILAMHGFTGPLVRWLREQGWDAEALAGPHEGGRGLDAERG